MYHKYTNIDVLCPSVPATGQIKDQRNGFIFDRYELTTSIKALNKSISRIKFIPQYLYSVEHNNGWLCSRRL